MSIGPHHLAFWMIVLSFCNHKGGTGKTTSAINVSAALGMCGYRTLVIDLDPQGFLTRMLGIDEPPVEASSLMLFDPNVDVRRLDMLALRGFDLLPSSSNLTKAMRKLNRPTDVLWAKEALEQELDYDVVIFDTAAAVTVYSLNALVASRFAVIPVTPEYQPVVGAEQTFRTVSMVREKLNPDLAEPFFLFTRVDARKRSHYVYRNYMRKQYEAQVLETIIRTSTSLSVSYERGSTVFDHDSHSRGALDYANATDEVLRRVEAAQQLQSDHAAAPDLASWQSLEQPNR